MKMIEPPKPKARKHNDCNQPIRIKLRDGGYPIVPLVGTLLECPECGRWNYRANQWSSNCWKRVEWFNVKMIWRILFSGRGEL